MRLGSRQTGPDGKAKVCIVSSCGGHLTEVRALKSAYEKYDHFYVLNHRVAIPEDMKNRTLFIRHSERDWLFFVNLYEAFRILLANRPDVILSTGAGPAVPFALVGNLLGIPSIFVETFARLNEPSLSGRIMYRLARRFFYQWEGLSDFYPKAICGGPLV